MDMEKYKALQGLDQEELVTFNQFWARMLALKPMDNANIKAILAEIQKFRSLAEKANELNKVVQQLDGYEGEEIKITLGMDGCINWPADELIARTNAMMSEVVLDLKQQEMIIERMAAAIGGEIVEEEPPDLALRQWSVDWTRDVNDFFIEHPKVNSRFQTALRSVATHWEDYVEFVRQGGRKRTKLFNKEDIAVLESLPTFDDVLPLIVDGKFKVWNGGPVMRYQLKQALAIEVEAEKDDEG